MGKKASIEVTAIPYAPIVGGDSAGQAQLDYITEGVYGRMEHSGLPDHLLLNEAIRFYNYGIGGNNLGLLINKRDWTPFDTSTVQKAMANLCAAISNDTVKMVSRLTANLQAHLNDQGKQFSTNSATNGLLVAHTLLSDRFRNEKKAALLENSVKRAQVSFRKFESLEETLSSLHKFFDFAYLQKELAMEFQGGSYGGCEDCLFLPQWGGDRIIQPAEGRLPGGRTFSWNPAQPIWPHKYQDVGPTEKIYFSLASSLFVGAHRTANTFSGQLPSTYRSELLRTFDERHYKSVAQILPIAPISPWQEWLTNLNHLELLFNEAVYQPAKAKAAPDYAGVQVGLPCAFALIAVLRAYVATLMGYALKVSLPLAIPEIYEKKNGYTAVALWEALSNQSVQGVESLGCLHQFGQNHLVGKLKSWRLWPFWDAWGDDVAENRVAVIELQKKYGEPLQMRKHPGDLKKINVSFGGFAQNLPRYPSIRVALFQSFVDASKHPIPDSELLGARFFAQAHAFVAMQILAKGLEVTGVTCPKDRKQQRIHKRFLKNFKISAGSYLYSGRKPPHETHRDGACFDFNFGPNLTPWPTSKAGEAFIWYSKQANGERNGELFCRRVGSKYGRICRQDRGQYRLQHKLLQQPFVVCSREEDIKQAELGNVPKNRVIFRYLVRKTINAQLASVYSFCDLSIEGKLEQIRDAEKYAYSGAENNLLGTPHFINLSKPDSESRKGSGLSDAEVRNLPTPEDWQRTHIAHTAILLSAPRNVVYASPIIHLRSMRAIREGFEGTEKPFMLASEMIRCAYFSFLPWNHHHHWHVDYNRVYWMEDRRFCIGDQTADIDTNPVARFAHFFPVWQAMGIDLSPLSNYLNGFQPLDHSLPHTVAAEYKDLKAKLGEYNRDYVRLYGSLDNPNLSARSEAETLVKKLFAPFRLNVSGTGKIICSDFLQPAVVLENGITKLSEYLEEIAKESYELLIPACLAHMGMQLKRYESFKEEEYEAKYGHGELEFSVEEVMSIAEDFQVLIEDSIEIVRELLGF